MVFEFGAGFARTFDTSAGDIYDFLVLECDLSLSLMSRWLRQDKSFNKIEFLERVDSGTDFYFMAYKA